MYLAMEISFKNRALRSLCEDPEAATAEYGSDVARALMNRVADIAAAETIENVIAGNPTISDSGKGDSISILLGEGHSIILMCNHLNPPTSALGKVDWSKVSRVRIEGIEACDA
ncbi:hypothetical protein [Mesorhizobium carmichaelinearum]|uniref:hypothetical protein n=1 Tax=Mesorhizobium carmichaelinearum TaxID=1208188 RepID=UPI000BA36132|nr:hypothetical protein [Mesorhizobium carmichaelinearum]